MEQDGYDVIFQESISNGFIDGILSLGKLKRYFRRYYKEIYGPDGDLERKLIEISPNIEYRYVRNFLEVYNRYISLFELGPDGEYLEYNSDYEREELEFRICNYLTASANVFVNAKMYAQSISLAETLNPRAVQEKLENDIVNCFDQFRKDQEEAIHGNFIYSREEDRISKKFPENN